MKNSMINLAKTVMNFKKISVFSALVCFSSITFAQQYNFELKGEYESWNVGSDYGDKASAVVGGAGLGYYKGQYFAGGGFGLGNYVLDDSDKSIKRTDLDLVIGKKVDKQLSLFTGYRFNQFRYSSKADPSLDRVENTLGLGGGASFSVPFTPKWIGFLSGVATGLYSYNNAEDKGKGYSVGTEGGLLYSVNSKTTIAVRVKYQFTHIEYDDGPGWEHFYTRVGANLGYLF